MGNLMYNWKKDNSLQVTLKTQCHKNEEHCGGRSTLPLVTALQKELPERPHHRIIQEWEHETLSQERRTWAYTRGVYFCHSPWSKLLVLPVHLLFIFYCLSLVMGQSGNESLRGRIRTVYILSSRAILDGLKMFLKLNSNYMEFHSFPAATLGYPNAYRARCINKPCPIHLFSRKKAKPE